MAFSLDPIAKALMSSELIWLMGLVIGLPYSGTHLGYLNYVAVVSAAPVCQILVDHWQPTCHSTELEKEKLLLLGVTLAELTLASPIGVRIEDHDAKFLVEGNWIALRELLTILRRKAGRDTIAKAVQYCLDPDSTSSKDQFRPEHMEEYCEKILLPLGKYYQIVTQHALRSSGKRLRRNKDVLSYFARDDNENLP
ncbi:hypothetical protein MMC12_006668 [Toensbergia leucococca]|nr:hypothetical protein [Toensbergia leucococca]